MREDYLVGGRSGEVDEVEGVCGSVHGEIASLLKNILASKGSSAGRLFKLDLELMDVLKTVFVELRMRGFFSISEHSPSAVTVDFLAFLAMTVC